MSLPATTHLVDFIAVIDHRGLAAAARALGRAQAAVTYSVQTLERDLGVILLDRTSRPLTPTPEGAVLASFAREIVQNISSLQLKAESLRSGLEDHVTLSLDALMPMLPVIRVAKMFGEVFPGVDLEIVVDAMSSPLTAVLDGESALGVCGPMALQHKEIEAIPIFSVSRVAVVAPGHPLANCGVPLHRKTLRKHRQIVMLSRDHTRRARRSVAVASSSWRTSDIGAKREMLLAGLGWGNMPTHLVEEDLAAGRLIELPIAYEVAADWSTPLQCYIVRSREHPLRPAAEWLFDCMGNGSVDVFR